MNVATVFDNSLKVYGKYNILYFEGKWYTNAELKEMADRLGNGLKTLGVRPGDSVATQMPNSIQIIVTIHAVLKIGAVIVPMNPMLRPDQISYIYRDSGAKVTMTTSDYLPWVKEAQQNAPELVNIVLTDKDSVPGTIYFPELLEGSSPDLKLEEMDGDDLAALIYTSGTTGNPKGVMHTHNSMWMSVMCRFMQAFTYNSISLTSTQKIKIPAQYKESEETYSVTGLNRSAITLAILPLSHVYGLSFLSLINFMGGTYCMLKRWNIQETLKMIQDLRVNMLTLVPAMYVQLLDSPDIDKYDLSSLRGCVSGSAPLDPELGRRWKEKVGLDLLEGWGMSESFAGGVSNSSERPPRYGSIGSLVLIGHQVKIFDKDDKELPVGQTGEIVMRGPSIMKGYWNLPEETNLTLKNGWLHSGDVGHMDEDGYFYITDRKKDLIIRGGENVSPKEVEEVINKHPGVLESACIGIKDRVYGEEIKAFVVLNKDAACSEADIIEFCKKHLPKFKTPKQVQFIAALPKNLLGKILRAELRKTA